VLTHFQRVMVAAQVYAGGCVSERQAVEIARKIEELTRDSGPVEETIPPGWKIARAR